MSVLIKHICYHMNQYLHAIKIAIEKVMRMTQYLRAIKITIEKVMRTACKSSTKYA